MNKTKSLQCKHRVQLATTQLPHGGWNGGIAFCDCCLSHYPFIDSGGMIFVDDEPRMTGIINDKHACRRCGGEERTWGFQ